MIDTFEVTLPELSGDTPRRAYVYLPTHYDPQGARRYPVLYMFDGHNVFFDEDATYGKSWGLGEYLDYMDSNLIVAAVECNHEGNRRLNEYTPVPFSFRDTGEIEPQGDLTMKWLIETFKPFIDTHYRTLPDRQHTAIAGSSMGGLMSLYAVTTYNDVFSMAAALSPSLWLGGEAMLSLMRDAHIAHGTRIYMDYGSEELGGRRGATDAFRAATDLLLEKGAYLTARIVPGGTHSEESWQRQIPVWMMCLQL